MRKLFTLLCLFSIVGNLFAQQTGSLSGLFSVSETEKVYFSQGNLQYQASSGTWRFAEHQYDMIDLKNKNISSTYSGWIDLFGYGTSGWNSGFEAYQPYSTGYDGYLVNSSLIGNYANADWGVYNKISNGGNAAGMWRVLTISEWEYVINGRKNASEKYGVAKVNGVKGLVLLPDSWTLPSNVSFTSGSGPYYATNTYTTSQWAKMEGNGAVFLPAANIRYNTTMNYESNGGAGSYWSSTASSNKGAYTMSIDAYGGKKWNEAVYMGMAVRLVVPFSSVSYTLTTIASPTVGGTVTVGGVLKYHTTKKLTATPKTGYKFSKWTVSGTGATLSSTTDATTTFTMGSANATVTAVFVKQSYTLTTTPSPSDGGSVTTGGTLQYQTTKQLTATPKTGYKFSKWTVSGTGATLSSTTDATTTFTMGSANATVTAVFVKQSYTLTTAPSPTDGGSVTTGGTLQYQTTKQLIATPKTGYRFSKWTVSGTGATLSSTTNATTTFTMGSANATVTATFIAIGELTVTSADEIMGTVTGSGTYDYNSSVTIKATPKTGYHFVKWDDDDINASRSVTITGDAAYTATFEANSYDITVLSVDESTGTVSGSGSYKYATTQTISATPVEHYHFQKWNDGNTENPRSITIAGTATYTATFVLDTFALAITVNDATMGTTSGSGSYAYNSSATAQAIPNYGYVFKKWNDGNTDNPRVVPITANTNLVANFVLDTFNISALGNDATKGTVTGSGKYPYNTEAILSANAIEHYHFVKWNDNDVTNPRTVTVTKDVSYIATFAIDTFAISAVANNAEMGIVAGSGSYIYGSEQDIEATANYGYVFKNWKDGETVAQRTITVTKNTTYTAIFEKDKFTISVSSSDNTKGTVSTDGGELEYLSEIQLVATPNEHYHFVKWSDGNAEATRTVTVTKDLNLSAEFAIDTFVLSVGETENGTVTGIGEYAYNAEATLTAVPAEHYHFVKWNDGETTNPRNVTVFENKTYSAEFAIDMFTVSLSSNATMGMVQGSDTYAYGETVTISALPNYGYDFKQWSDGNTSASREIVISEDLQLEAVFEKTTFSINIVSNSNDKGTVTVIGGTEYLSDIQLVATPNEHYHFVQWSDGNTDASRNLIVTEEIDLTAEFAIDTFELTVGECKNGTITGAAEYAYSTEATLTAVPTEHYHFVKWSDGVTTNPRNVTVTENKTFVAEFAIDMFELSVGEIENGSITGVGEYAYNTETTLTAVPAEHYHFVKWADGETTNPRNVTVSEDKVFIAEFELDVFTISGSGENGNVQGTGEFVYGSEILLTAVSNEHYHFIKWADGETANPRKVTVTENVSYDAKFVIDTFTVNLTVNKSEMGTVVGAGEYAYGQKIEIQAIPNNHYTFVKWNDDVADEEREIVVTDNITYKAIFEESTYSIMVESLDETMGTVKIVGSSFKYGEEIIVMATARPGYHFTKWNDGDENPARTVTIEANKVFIAYFEANTTAIEDIVSEMIITIFNRSILVNGEAPAFVYTISGQKIVNQNLKFGVYFVNVDGETVKVVVN